MAAPCAFGLRLDVGDAQCVSCVVDCARWWPDPYRDNEPDEDGDVSCHECGGVFPGLDELRAAGRARYPRLCRDCRAEEEEDSAAS